MVLDYTGFSVSPVTSGPVSSIAVDRPMMFSAPELVRVPAGDFTMGAHDGEEDERPVHRVFVSEFLIGAFPVTQEQYWQFVRDSGHPAPAVRELPLIASGGRDALFRDLSTLYVWRDNEPPRGCGSHPVVLVTYEDARAYCAWASDRWGRLVRLPTEAEWEKTARGGSEGLRYPWGDTLDSSHGSFLADPAAKRRGGTRPVGSYAPNAFGVYDMIGNVWEWVSDWYAADYYATDHGRDPHGPAAGAMRIVRGGSWVSEAPNMLRTSYRHKVPPDTYAYSIGFRVVCPC
jgi:formylglycine-generating enzyme required for sulfatase activity